MSNKTNHSTDITGREPCLSPSYGKQGQQRLSLRGLATMLNVLPPHAIALEVTAEALRSEAFYVRYSAGKMLARRGDRDARLVLQGALNNGQAPTRASAARHLYGFSWFSVEPLIRQALRDPDRRVREAVVYALCDMRDLNAYETMATALQHEDDSVRMAAAWGLRDCQDVAAVPVLAAVLLAADPDVRVKALEALGANDTPDAIPVVRRSLTDPHPDVIYAGTLSLLELEGEASLQEIADVIRHTSGDARAQVLRGFFHASNYLKFDVAGHPLADTLIDALEIALGDDVIEARRAAIWPLAWIKHPRAPAILRQAYYQEPNREMKALFMRVAVSLMSEGSEELLQDALHNQDEVVRSAAERIVRERAQVPGALPVVST